MMRLKAEPLIKSAFCLLIEDYDTVTLLVFIVDENAHTKTKHILYTLESKTEIQKDAKKIIQSQKTGL